MVPVSSSFVTCYGYVVDGAVNSFPVDDKSDHPHRPHDHDAYAYELECDVYSSASHLC